VSDDWLWNGGPPPDPDEARRIAALQTLARDRKPPALPDRPRRWVWPVVGTLVVAAIVLLAIWTWPQPQGWEIRTLSGTAPCAGARCSMWPGDTLNVPDGSRWELDLGTGTVQVAGGSTLTRIDTDGFPMRLDSGSVEVQTKATAFALRIETPSATAIDLGCAFALEADAQGTRLSVTEGAVALQNDLGTSVVGGGSAASAAIGAAPSIPLRRDAPDALRAAIDANDLDAILANARGRDLFTLWHVLQLVAPAERQRVLDRIVELEPGVLPTDEARLVALDPDALKVLWQDLVPQAYTVGEGQ
jgi:hypothetical protein